MKSSLACVSTLCALLTVIADVGLAASSAPAPTRIKERFPDSDTVSPPIETEAEAKQVAYRSYLRGGIQADEGLHEARLIIVAFELPGFCVRDDHVWELRATTSGLNEPEPKLRAIIWVNQRTGAVRRIVGPWSKSDPP